MHVNVHLYDDLDAVEADAAAMLDRAAQPRLFDRIAWFRLIAAHLPDRRPLVIRAEQSGARAWLFLSDRGDGTAEALAAWYTLAFAPVFAAPAERHAALIAACAKAARTRFHRITLAPMEAESRDGVVRAFAATGWGTIAAPATVSRRTAVSDGFDAWWAGRPGRLRNTARRKARASPFRIEIADGFDPDLWTSYETVYADSWKGQEGSPALLRALAMAEGQAGTLRLGVAWLDDRPVAAQWWLVENGRATIHKLAHVDALRAQSPGTVLSAAMFRHVIERDRPAIVDFGTGDEPYKAEWMEQRHLLWRVDLFSRSSPRGLGAYLRARAAALVRARKDS